MIFLLMAIIKKINGLRCSVPKINGHENIDLPTSVI